MNLERKAADVQPAAQSLCPVCLSRIEGHYRRRDGGVYLEKTCPLHGDFSALVWEEGADFATFSARSVCSPPLTAGAAAEKGCPYDCGLCAEHGQAACCVLIEITQRCNQHCPYCFASAQRGGKDDADYSLEEMDSLLVFLRERCGAVPFNLQLSGGEPTLHPQLAQIIKLCRARGFSYVQVNTNGRRIAEDAGYAVSLRKAGLHTVFLQFDGTGDAIYQRLRGEALLEQKEAAIANSVAAGLGVVLVVTVVPGVNDGNLGEIIAYAARRLPRVRGVHFQPVSYFGRYPTPPQDDARITLPGLMRRMAEQTDGKLSPADFVPLASGHGRCSFHGNFLWHGGGVYALSREQADGDHGIEKARAYLARRWGPEHAPDGGEVPKCSCCGDGVPKKGGAPGGAPASGGKPPPDPKNEPLGHARTAAFDAGEWAAIAKTLRRQTLGITAMAFQDAWTVDLERLRRCRLHVATRDKRLVPFCAYNITAVDGRRLHGGPARG